MCYRMDCFGTYFTHAQCCEKSRVQSATEWTASVHTSHMSNAVKTFGFKVIRNGVRRYILYIHMPKPVITFVLKVIRNGLLRCIVLHMSKPVITFMFKVLQNGLLRYLLYTLPNAVITFVFKALREWIASVHTLHMPKAVITFVLKVLRNGPLRYILHFTHAQGCDIVRVQNASGHMLNFRDFEFSRFPLFAFSRFRVFAFRVCVFSCDDMLIAGSSSVFPFSRFCVFAFCRRHPRGRDTDWVCTALQRHQIFAPVMKKISKLSQN